MAIYLVQWTESAMAKSQRVGGVNSPADAAWLAALESVEDPTNAKLMDVIRLD